MINHNSLIEKLRPFTVGLKYEIKDYWNEELDGEIVVSNGERTVELQVGADYVCINEHTDTLVHHHGDFQSDIDGLDWMAIAKKLRELLLT